MTRFWKVRKMTILQILCSCGQKWLIWGWTSQEYKNTTNDSRTTLLPRNDKIMKRGRMAIERQNGQKWLIFGLNLVQISNNIRKTSEYFWTVETSFSIQKRLLKHQIRVKWQHFEKCRKLSFLNFFEAVEWLSSKKIVPSWKRVPLTHHLHKKRRMSVVPLDVASESIGPNDVARDLGPVIAFGANLQTPVSRQ